MKSKRWVILAVLVLGVVVRFKDLPMWWSEKWRDYTFCGGKPLLTCSDGYYYLRLADDVVRGEYQNIDELRGNVDVQYRPRPVPLLSMLIAAGVWCGGDIDWVGFILPALLGVLVAVPVCMMGVEYGWWCAFVGVSMSLFAPYYVARTGMGWCDTDCGNVFFALLAGVLWMRFARSSGRWRLVYLCLAVCAGLCFWMWWHTVPGVVVGLFFIPAVWAVLDLRGVALWRRLVLCSVIGVVGCVGLYEFYWCKIEELFFHLLWGGANTTAEQSNPGLMYAARAICGLEVLFFIGVAGFIWLCVQHWRDMFYFGGVIGIGLMSVKAERYMIFAVPLIALGLGYLAEKVRVRGALVAMFAICLVFMGWFYKAHTMAWPKVLARQVEAWKVLRFKAEPDAVVWCWWDMAYAAQYYARRTTLFDGSIHGGYACRVNAFPYCAKDFEDGAGFLKLYAGRGRGGLTSVAKANNLQRDDFTNIAKRLPHISVSVPVYFIVDAAMFRVIECWYWYGTREKYRGVDDLAGSVFWRLSFEEGVGGLNFLPVFDNGFSKVFKVR